MNAKLLNCRTYKQRLLRVLGSLVSVGMLFTLASCKQMLAVPRILKEGDSLHGMVISTGTPGATPLDAFCNLEMDEDVTNTINCEVLLVSKLAIGHVIGVTHGPLQQLDWLKLTWQVYLDGYLLDLATFHQQSYIEPGQASAPSEIREVSRQRKTWDIVLINPSFGLHTLLCTVTTGSLVYNWVVNFMIESTGRPVDALDLLPVRTSADQDAWEVMAWVEGRSMPGISLII
jgi:hypothetical protein